MIQSLQKLATLAEPELSAAKSVDELYTLKAKYLGKKGELSEVLKGLKDLSTEERPKIGSAANELRDRLEQLIAKKVEEIENVEISKKLASEKIDVTLPGKRRNMGAVHPLNLVIDRLSDIFAQLGFSYITGPEVETEFCNFEALNVPADHPARDMQDTLYLKPGVVLRTHTSSVQIRAMLAQKPPLKLIMPGAVFRSDPFDASHAPMFHQI